MENNFCLSDDWENLMSEGILIPYGVGRIGSRVILTLKEQFNIPFLLDSKIDHDEKYGLKVYNIEDVKQYILDKKCKIVVTTVHAAYLEICENLNRLGLRENEDFCLFERFTIEWNLRWKNKCVLSKIDSVITTKCTLRCLNCNMFIGYMMEHEDLLLEDLKKNFDVFFDSVDYVYEYTLLGGEPFLHADLKEILCYLSKQYGNRVGKINLISNGTVIPSDEILNIMKQNNMMITVSNYTHIVPYEEKMQAVIKKLEEHEIEYYIIPNNTWKDVLFPRCEYHAKDVRNHMILCGHSTHSMNDGKLYWCDPAFSAERFLKFKSQKNDSLDLESNKKNNTKYQASLNIMKYLLGDVNEKGYMSFCERCAGVGCDNTNIVIAGQQFGGK